MSPHLLTGADAWQNGFSAEAAAWMAVQKAFAWDDATFRRALVLCGRYARGERVNTRTVIKVFAQLEREADAAGVPKRPCGCERCAPSSTVEQS